MKTTNQPLTLSHAINQAANMISGTSHIVAFTGAGISTDSGIPDLAGIDHILSDDRQFHGGVFGMLNSQFASQDPREFYRLYRKTFFHPEAVPNPAHRFLAELEQRGQLSGIATMNIDWLHQMAGSKTVFEYWGDMRLNHCIGCHRTYDWSLAKDQIIPHCPICGSPVIPDFVLKNLATDHRAVHAGQALIAQASWLIIVGTNRSAGSFPSRIPKIIINEALTNQFQNHQLIIGGRASQIFNLLGQQLHVNQRL